MKALKMKTNPKRLKILSAKGKETLWGFLFITPNLIGFLVFTLFGVVFSLVMAFTDWNLLRGYEQANFVGLKNFIAMFNDPYLTASLRNNGLLLLVIPVALIIAAILASVMNRVIYGNKIVRALFFLPYVTNIVAVATVWQALLHPSKGPVNSFLMSLGISLEDVPRWLSTSKWALPAVMIIILWQTVGYYILMYSAALQNIPKDYYEAAEIDGAGPIRKFISITLPMLKPTTFMLSILGIIGSLQMWAFMQIITNGGPGTATYTLGLYIYRSAFVTYRTGYACALSWLLCVIVLIFTLIQWRSQKKWSND